MSAASPCCRACKRWRTTTPRVSSCSSRSLRRRKSPRACSAARAGGQTGGGEFPRRRSAVRSPVRTCSRRNARGRGARRRGAVDRRSRRIAVALAAPTFEPPQLAAGQRYIRGLYSGGTFCYEATLLLGETSGRRLFQHAGRSRQGAGRRVAEAAPTRWSTSATMSSPAAVRIR